MSHPLRILFIEDDPDDRLLVIEELRREFSELEITVITDAQSWAQALEASDFDLVITDYALGWTDGLTVLKAVKARWPDHPVIMFTGTGSEEIFGGGACPNQEYAGPYTGFHIIENKNFAGKNAMYRFHVLDPVHFKKSIRVSIEHGHANDLGNDYSSTAYWYQVERDRPLPPLPPVGERLPRPDPPPAD